MSINGKSQGRKRWYLRPTQELLRRLSCQAKAKPCNIGGLEESKQGNSKSQTTIIECSEGDMIVLNTRLWWHRTVIPPHYNLNEPSVSYARDMYMLPRCGLKTHFESDKRIMSDNSIVDHSNLLQQSERRGEEGLEIMSNLDGLYAANDIDVNTIIFTEASMPDCSLHRSSVPNCQVIQMEEGSGAVVSIRQIKAGDFFCVGESDDDEEDEDTDAAEGDDDFDSSNECDEENCGVRDMERRMDKCD